MCFVSFFCLCLLYTNNEHLGPFIYNVYLSFVTQFSGFDFRVSLLTIEIFDICLIFGFGLICFLFLY